MSVCWERFLLPYLGVNKTFTHVREVLEVIDGKFNEAEYRKRDKKLKMFPGVEFLPVVQKAKEDQKPAAKKGEITYKKITLDQPAFNRKKPSCEKETYPEIDNKADVSTTIKRETFILFFKTHPSKRVFMTLVYNAPPSLDEHKALFIKRRRLTRGYEKHGFDEEVIIAIEKEGREGEE